MVLKTKMIHMRCVIALCLSFLFGLGELESRAAEQVQKCGGKLQNAIQTRESKAFFSSEKKSAQKKIIVLVEGASSATPVSFASYISGFDECFKKMKQSMRNYIPKKKIKTYDFCSIFKSREHRNFCSDAEKSHSGPLLDSLIRKYIPPEQLIKGLSGIVYLSQRDTDFGVNLLKIILRETPDTKIFLVGHSMGGKAVLDIATALESQDTPVYEGISIDPVDQDVSAIQSVLGTPNANDWQIPKSTPWKNFFQTLDKTSLLGLYPIHGVSLKTYFESHRYSPDLSMLDEEIEKEELEKTANDDPVFWINNAHMSILFTEQVQKAFNDIIKISFSGGK